MYQNLKLENFFLKVEKADEVYLADFEMQKQKKKKKS